VEKFNRPSLVTFTWNGQDATAEVSISRLTERNIAEEGMNRCKAVVACPYRVSTVLLDVLKEGTDEGDVQIFDAKRRRIFTEPF
jgi:hypothetical protein